MPAATAAAEPELDPPGVCARLWGLRAGEGSKKANSVVCTLPRMTAPCALSASTISASLLAGGAEARERLLARVGRPSTSMMSLIATGTPCSGPADAALGRLALALGGNGKGALAVHLAPALHVRIGFRDAIEIAARERDRRQRPAGDGGRQLAHPPRIGDVARLRCGHCFPSSLAQPPGAPCVLT